MAESLAEDVKLVAARHQHAARRMEVCWHLEALTLMRIPEKTTYM